MIRNKVKTSTVSFALWIDPRSPIDRDLRLHFESRPARFSVQDGDQFVLRSCIDRVRPRACNRRATTTPSFTSATPWHDPLTAPRLRVHMDLQLSLIGLLQTVHIRNRQRDREVARRPELVLNVLTLCVNLACRIEIPFVLEDACAAITVSS